MNKNLINYEVRRTREGTVIEVACGIIMLLSLVISIVQLCRDKDMGGPMLAQSLICGFCILIILVLAYAPHTFNIPDDSPAELFAATVRSMRIIAVLTALFTLGLTLTVLFGIRTELILIGYGIAFVAVLMWFISKQMKIKRERKQNSL